MEEVAGGSRGAPADHTILANGTPSDGNQQVPGSEPSDAVASTTFLAVSSHSRRLISALRLSTWGTSTGMRRPRCSTSRIFFRGAFWAAKAAALAFHSSAFWMRAVRPSVSGTAAGRDPASFSIACRVANAGRVLNNRQCNYEVRDRVKLGLIKMGCQSDREAALNVEMGQHVQAGKATMPPSCILIGEGGMGECNELQLHNMCLKGGRQEERKEGRREGGKEARKGSREQMMCVRKCMDKNYMSQTHRIQLPLAKVTRRWVTLNDGLQCFQGGLVFGEGIHPCNPGLGLQQLGSYGFDRGCVMVPPKILLRLGCCRVELRDLDTTLLQDVVAAQGPRGPLLLQLLRPLLALAFQLLPQALALTHE
ncbi:MAG: hypothetical protein FRX49_13327 [Trebouxia sp. A1-2]|nr:MAG: hypothetical protein FRX49_13327 [Trebouxia sp. A1-2]